MEKPYAYIGAATICLTLSFSLYAEELKKKPEVPDYWLCRPVFVQIDYSYLREGEWIGNEFREKLRENIAKIDNYQSDEKRTWGLVNCMF